MHAVITTSQYNQKILHRRPMFPLFKHTWFSNHEHRLPLAFLASEQEMATHSGALAWRIPWKRSLEDYSPQGHKESDIHEATEHARIFNLHQPSVSDKARQPMEESLISSLPNEASDGAHSKQGQFIDVIPRNSHNAECFSFHTSHWYSKQ